MTAAEVYHGFWTQFGIPAYEEGAAFAVPAPEVRCPCLTYRYGEGDRADLTVSLWVRSSSWREAQTLAERIGSALPPGGVLLSCEGGGIWILRGSPWRVSAGEEDDPLVRKIVFNVTVRFYIDGRLHNGGMI